jgi:MYXO-CTERM domain-containing protein
MKKLPACLMLALVAGGAAPAEGGSEAPAEGAARRPKGTHTPASENPYFVSDPHDPAVLHPAPAFLERGFDHGYVEHMARGLVTKEMLEGMRHPQELPVPLRAGDFGGSPFAATSLRGNVFVIEGTSQMVVAGSQGGLRLTSNGLFIAADAVLRALGDNFDFITVWNTFEDFDAAAFYLPMRNDVRGLGECNFNSGDTFGCVFDQTGGLQLQGLVYMNSVQSWRFWDEGFDGVVHPIDSFDSAVYSTLGQEIAHRWGAALRFVDPRSGAVSRKLLGRDRSHWAAWVDTDASVMDGWDWVDQGGRFKIVNDMDRYSTLDLYTMGALPVAAARPFFFIDGAVFDERTTGQFRLGLDGVTIPSDAVLGGARGQFIPSASLMEAAGIDLGANGTRVDLTIQDVVDAEGNRCPDPDHTQKSFRQLFVLVTRPGQTIAQADRFASELETVAQTWEAWWSDRTANALTLCTNATSECEHAEATLGGGGFESEAGDYIELGTTMTLKVTAGARGDGLKNARLVLSLDGSGAERARLEEDVIPVGNIAEDTDVEIPVKISFNDDYKCSASTIVIAQLVSDNAQTVREDYRLFPGHATIFVDTFASGADEFVVNADGQDRARTGALERVNIELTCDMTKRTPERDMTPGTRGAYVTGATTELDGDTSLWSPEINLRGTVDPILVFDFWLEGDEGDTLRVQLSDDGEKFVDVFEEAQQIHGWGLARIRIAEAFDNKPPDSVVVRFLFAGKGRLEGAIDNFRIIDAEGRCRAIAQGFCGCSADGGASPQASLLVLAGLFGLRAARRKQRRA